MKPALLIFILGCWTIPEAIRGSADVYGPGDTHTRTTHGGYTPSPKIGCRRRYGYGCCDVPHGEPLRGGQTRTNPHNPCEYLRCRYGELSRGVQDAPNGESCCQGNNCFHTCYYHGTQRQHGEVFIDCDCKKKKCVDGSVITLQHSPKPYCSSSCHNDHQ